MSLSNLGKIDLLFFATALNLISDKHSFNQMVRYCVCLESTFKILFHTLMENVHLERTVWIKEHVSKVKFKRII